MTQFTPDPESLTLAQQTRIALSNRLPGESSATVNVVMEVIGSLLGELEDLRSYRAVMNPEWGAEYRFRAGAAKPTTSPELICTNGKEIRHVTGVYQSSLAQVIAAATSHQREFHSGGH